MINMNDFTPQGLPEYNPTPGFGKSEEKWRMIVFRIEELEGKVPRDREIQDNTIIKRTLPQNAIGDFMDLIIYKKKPILKIYTDFEGKLRSEPV